jgi:hypothetical protein
MSFEVKLPIFAHLPRDFLAPARCLGTVLLCAIFLSGCDNILKGLGFIPENDPGDTESEEPGWNGVPIWPELNNPSIKVKFGVDVNLTGTKAVDAAFHELSAFIKKDGLSAPSKVIKLGDWIDLEGGLSVAVDEDGDYTGGFNATNIDVNPVSPPFTGYEGKTLRLIVVGINSFQSKNGYLYQGEPAPPDHVVFQFQNLPVTRRMNEQDTITGGYAQSEMRKYLVKVGGNGGNFLAGLKTAGVPADVLWAPTRSVSNGIAGTEPDAINDLLWLPTAREMFGRSQFDYVSTQETELNQARLDYYDGDDRRKKYFANSEYRYWESTVGGISSGNSPSFFYAVIISSSTPSNSANSAGGCAPAFCVQ